MRKLVDLQKHYKLANFHQRDASGPAVKRRRTPYPLPVVSPRCRPPSVRFDLCNRFPAHRRRPDGRGVRQTIERQQSSLRVWVSPRFSEAPPTKFTKFTKFGGSARRTSGVGAFGSARPGPKFRKFRKFRRPPSCFQARPSRARAFGQHRRHPGLGS
jgi:hypothetical protein